MAKTLVVVESPAKAKTIEKYLGPDYTVRASYGHIRDLPKSNLGVDVDREFRVTYEVPEDSKKHVAELKRALKAADGLVLATDYDREGEAIAYHVAELLGVEPAGASRVTFTEITRDAILEAFSQPREIDLKLFDAQEARRVLDRLVGYKISPILWRKVRPGLSAGRVQSVAVRLIVEREREIQAFTPVEYWSVDVRLTPEGDTGSSSDRGSPDQTEQRFTARLQQIPEGKLAASPDKKGIVLSSEADAATHAERLRSAAYRVTDVERKERKKSPSPPFKTSTLQQEAARKLGFSARKTMTIAQRLYEGVNIPGEGTVGLITYMRTDSLNLADAALREIAEVVKTEFGERYTIEQPRRYKTRSRNAQEAHEAIRPTSALRTPARVAATLDRDQLRLYTLIWQRTVATQMADARFNQVGVDIRATSDGGTYGLRATGQTMLFDGFIRVYTEGRDDTVDEDAEARLPELRPDQVLRMLEVLPEQHFTQAPPRYTEASLVKTLEELGIGRPSTYASIISTIQDRGYVRLEDRRFVPEDVGYVVTDGLVQHFADIVDVNFTAQMEEELDEIAEGQARRVQVLHDFYRPFEQTLERAEEKFERYVEDLDEECPKCVEEGRIPPGRLQKRLGRYGFFIGCSRFADEDGGCRYIRNLNGDERPEPELLDETCPQCGRPLARKFGRFGPFVGCSGYPDCTYIKKDPPKSTGITCPQCTQGEIVEKRTRFGVMFGCDRYPECDFAVGNPPVKDHPCPECGSLVVERPKSFRCWNCGAEFDKEWNPTKPGDVEAEASARAAKAAARDARAKARSAKKTTAKKRTTATKRTTAKKSAANKGTARRASTTRTAATRAADDPGAAEPHAAEG
ncbi:MAG TPA: type I DNA topoisomerase [Actinomycetota bacterium]|nr:type I DNA topoisomerase [Actinomycetota bacterium]